MHNLVLSWSSEYIIRVASRLYGGAGLCPIIFIIILIWTLKNELKLESASEFLKKTTNDNSNLQLFRGR